MRKIESKTIIKIVANLCSETNFELPEDVLKSIKRSIPFETGLAKSILKEILKNAYIAKTEQIPLCQDTGVANFFVKLGKNVNISNGDIYDSISKGTYVGYKHLRKSMVYDPIERKNLKDNLPANIYVDLVPGDTIKITFLPKGGGSENSSALKMLIPSMGWNGIKEFVLRSVIDKGRNACPPLIVGIGIGGDFASVGLIAKKALLREIGSNHKIDFYKKKEQELLNEINKLNIGPMGIGGKITALAVFIEARPTHMASLPTAINLQCHSCRRKTIVI